VHPRDQAKPFAMKKIALIIWFTLLCFLMLGNVHAWEVPYYLRVVSGSRMWFSWVDGDLIQPDNTKLGLTNNLGVKQHKLVWEFLASFRAANIHVLRFKAEPDSLYNEAHNDSYHRVRNIRIGYDLDFFMTPQFLAGANVDVDIMQLDTQVNNVTVGGYVYDYADSDTRTIPSLGLHGTFYPILEGVSLRPNLSTRINWWDYENRRTLDWEVAAAVDIPVNHLWTWSINGGYRLWNVELKRTRDRVDMTRGGFFIETSVLF
jgi:hypothetical protein